MSFHISQVILLFPAELCHLGFLPSEGVRDGLLPCSSSQSLSSQWPAVQHEAGCGFNNMWSLVCPFKLAKFAVGWVVYIYIVDILMLLNNILDLFFENFICEYNIFWLYPPTLSSPSTPGKHSYVGPPQPCSYFFFIYSLLCLVSSTCVCMNVGPSTAAWETMVTILKKKQLFPLLSSHKLPIAFSLGVGASCSSPPSMLECWLPWSCAGFTEVIQVITVMSCHVQKTISHSTPPIFWIFHSFSSFWDLSWRLP